MSNQPQFDVFLAHNSQDKPDIIQADDLSSAKGVDYTQLQNLLAVGKWKEADEETLAVMLKASGREAEGWLDEESIENFPCTDLRTIDQLWVKYSNERFGLSVQKHIWESVRGNPDASYETFCKFGDRVGWRVKDNWIDYPDEVIFSTSAPEGHLPLQLCSGLRCGCGDGIWVYGWCLGAGGLVSVLSRPDL
ncbi:MAG: GUN4 domain-containing protein [Fischerella sp. CENA71]|nr:GUN4 domain-containing protein [Fischerella sp. CENA71]